MQYIEKCVCVFVFVCLFNLCSKMGQVFILSEIHTVLHILELKRGLFVATSSRLLHQGGRHLIRHNKTYHLWFLHIDSPPQKKLEKSFITLYPSVDRILHSYLLELAKKKKNMACQWPGTQFSGKELHPFRYSPGNSSAEKPWVRNPGGDEGKYGWHDWHDQNMVQICYNIWQ